MWEFKMAVIRLRECGAAGVSFSKISRGLIPTRTNRKAVVLNHLRRPQSIAIWKKCLMQKL